MTLAILASALWGSFANMLIARLPQITYGKKGYGFLFRPNSHCPVCLSEIPRYHLIPVISYLLLRGKCACCKAGFGYRYFVVELLSVASVGFLVLVPGNLGFMMMLMSWLLIPLSFIDIEHFLLPDELTLAGIWLGLGLHVVFFPSLVFLSFWGAVAGYLSLKLIAWVYAYFRKKVGLGGGDAKLFAMLGAFLGFHVLAHILLIASCLGLVAFLCGQAKRQTRL